MSESESGKQMVPGRVPGCHGVGGWQAGTQPGPPTLPHHLIPEKCVMQLVWINDEQTGQTANYECEWVGMNE